ncbi:hypothetical protein ACFLSW_00840 [Candidatus Bipolaricaulota bacterium]
MPRKCTVCVHPDRDSIDDAILTGTSLRDIARQWCVSKDAIKRHADNHIAKDLAAAHKAQESTRVDSLMDRVEKLLDESQELLEHGKHKKNAGAWAAGIREARMCLELLAKVRGELNAQPTVNVLLASPEMSLVLASVLQVLNPYPELKQEIAGVLSERQA